MKKKKKLSHASSPNTVTLVLFSILNPKERLSHRRQTDRHPESCQSSGSGRTRAKLAQIPLLLHLLPTPLSWNRSAISGGERSFEIPPSYTCCINIAKAPYGWPPFLHFVKQFFKFWFWFMSPCVLCVFFFLCLS